MALQQPRAIKGRIKSVRNTRKITKAMELVAASKMRRAVQNTLATRPYTRAAWEAVRSVGLVTDASHHALLSQNDSDRTLIIMITSDRGLAGGFNTNVLRQTMGLIKKYGAEKTDVVCAGRKGADAMRRAGMKMVAAFMDVTSKPTFEQVLPIGRFAVEAYLRGEYGRVVIAYTDYVSAVTQKSNIFDLLPLAVPEELEKGTGGTEVENQPTIEYLFEPSPKEVLDRLLPRIVEAAVFHLVLESTASEHSSRMLAMRNASDAARDMIDALTLSFNQARQAGITKEIAEIAGGKAALENKS